MCVGCGKLLLRLGKRSEAMTPEEIARKYVQDTIVPDLENDIRQYGRDIIEQEREEEGRRTHELKQVLAILQGGQRSLYQAVADEREQCRRDVCEGCAEGWPLVERQYAGPRKTVMQTIHQIGYAVRECRALPIQQRVEREKSDG